MNIRKLSVIHQTGDMFYCGASMNRDRSLGMNDRCQVKMDRLILTAAPRDKAGIKNVSGFRRVSDFRPQPQGKIRTYLRVLKLRSMTTSCEIVVQYDPQLPWLAPLRITVIGDDVTGVTPGTLNPSSLSPGNIR